MEFSLTEWWVPAAAIGILGIYLFRSALQEARLPLPAAAGLPANESAGSDAPESTPAEAAPAAKAVSSSKASSRKSGFIMRTAWIWGSLLIGAGAQAYLTYMAG